MKRIYISNLPFETDASELSDWFHSGGVVAREVKVITDKDTGRSRGFAFAEVESAEEVVANFNDQDLGGRRIKVQIAVAKPR